VCTEEDAELLAQRLELNIKAEEARVAVLEILGCHNPDAVAARMLCRSGRKREIPIRVTEIGGVQANLVIGTTNVSLYG